MMRIFHILLNPVSLFIILLGAALVFHFLRRTMWTKLFFTSAIVWMVLISSTPLPQWLVHRLEMQYPAIDLSEVQYDSAYILVLGGGHSITPQLPASMQLSGSAVVRLAEGIRIYRQVKNSRLVCSGYSVSGRTTQAEMLATAAVELGVSPADTLQLRTPGNTQEEIREFKERFGAVPVIVVSSASHMPRVMMICELEGLSVVAAPAEFLMKEDEQQSFYEFLPSVEKIGMMSRAMHEYGGMIKLMIVHQE